MKSRILTVLILAIALPVFAGDILEFRIAQYDQASGWSRIQIDGESLWLSPKPELTSVHVASAEFRWSLPVLSSDEIAKLEKMAQGGTIDADRDPQVLINFNENGAALFAKVTEDNYLNRLAILSDGIILAAPVIRERITSGRVVIHDELTEADARYLVKKLNAEKSNK